MRLQPTKSRAQNFEQLPSSFVRRGEGGQSWLLVSCESSTGKIVITIFSYFKVGKEKSGIRICGSYYMQSFLSGRGQEPFIINVELFYKRHIYADILIYCASHVSPAN